MSNKNRKAAEDFIIEMIGKIIPGEENKNIYLSLFKSMSDEDFDKFITDLEQDTSRLAIVAPNFGKENLSVERNLKVAEELGHNFFERIYIESEDNPTYLTPIPYMVVDLPLRRQAQLLIKKISIPEDNNSVDDFTGQPSGKSQGSKISYPETQVMASMGLDNSLIEMIKYRGGDTKGFQAMNTSISRTGSVSLEAIKNYSGGVESTRTLSTYLRCMHLDNTMLSK